ncbi:MAG: AMIN domain-containing protein [Proteobacteria bacterium]|nr:AMIN domain-containing protein [Pseudomonadota bacterium]MBU1709110.1 AMIN domain-containing protein [Pseudomonadota bacterium]
MTLILQTKYWLVFPVALLLLFTFTTSEAETTPAIPHNSYKITNLQWEQTADEFLLRIQGETLPTYTIYELFDPMRIIIDIADAGISEDVSLPLDLPHGPVTQVNGQILGNKEPAIARIEVFLSKDQAYSVEKEDNDILIKFAKVLATEEIKQQQEAKELKSTEDPFLAVKNQQVSGIKLASTISSIDIEKSASETRVYIKADGPIIKFENVALEKTEGRPHRMYIDIGNVKPKGLTAFQEVGSTLARIRTAPRENGVRIVFDSALGRLFTYDTASMSDGLLVVIQESPDEIIAEAAKLPTSMVEPGKDIQEAATSSATPVKPLVEGLPAKKPTKTEDATAALLDDFSFSGYTQKRITVDFYKIDLHNVFRLIGDISGLNIVVAEGVGGSLTLALSDVPWDFALDIILNLKDLQKEERFNTIVISPKSKSFSWPKRATDNLAIKADDKVMDQIQKEEDSKTDSISVKNKFEQPKAVVEAKKLILLAQSRENAGDPEQALSLFEDAYSLWPDNGQLATRIASLCLVQLGLNAKAVHYAKAALQIDQNDKEAALQAAIGLASMKKTDKAREYFDLAINTPLPSSEALASYASFYEENREYDSALSLLARHEELYGDNLDTMISTARVNDKMGNDSQAVKEYKAILLSGFEMPPDLLKYIKGRISMATN